MIINTNKFKIPTQHLYFTRVGVYNSQTDNFTRLVKYVRLVFFAQTFFCHCNPNPYFNSFYKNIGESLQSRSLDFRMP